MSVSTWRNAFAREMKALHQQALAAGDPTINNDRRATTYIDQVMEAQLGFLDKWTVEIQAAPEFDEGWVARSALYALSVKQDYWTGVTHFLPLPAMPGDGTSQCLGNCGCRWDIVWLDEAHMDADAYWRLGKSDTCQTCKIRAADWAPLQIRAGDLLVTKAWPKGRHLSAAHRAKISEALRRGKGQGPGTRQLSRIPASREILSSAHKLSKTPRLFSYGAKNFADSEYKSFRDNLSKEQKSAITSYSGKKQYKIINDHLRKGGPIDNRNVQNIQHLTEALKSQKTPYDLRLYRGAGNSLSDKIKSGELRSGSVFKDNGFGSTSLTSAATFPGAQLNIFYPKGSPGAALRGVTKYPKEEEFLIPPGATYRVLRTYESKNGLIYADVEYLP
jgi:hypothetical protein